MGSRHTRPSFNLNFAPSAGHVTAASVSLAAKHKPYCGAGKPYRGGGTGTVALGQARTRRCGGGMQNGMQPFRGHFSVCTVSQRDLGILHLKRGMCGPDAAVPQAKIQIKSSSAPCPGQSRLGSARAPQRSEGAERLFKGWFCTNILLPSTDRERHSTLQPGTSAQPPSSKQSTA